MVSCSKLPIQDLPIPGFFLNWFNFFNKSFESINSKLAAINLSSTQSRFFNHIIIFFASSFYQIKDDLFNCLIFTFQYSLLKIYKVFRTKTKFCDLILKKFSSNLFNNLNLYIFNFKPITFLLKQLKNLTILQKKI